MKSDDDKAEGLVTLPETTQLPANDREPVSHAITASPPPSRSLRPPMAGREHSTHIYRLRRGPVSRLQSTGDVPEHHAAHVNRQRSASLPLESVVTVRPSRGPPSRPPAPERKFSGCSTASSGISLNEVSAPGSLREKLDGQSPGTYRCIITDVSGKAKSFDSIDGAPGRKATIGYELQQLDTYDQKSATREQLEHLLKSHPMPKPQGPEWLNRLRYGFFSTYRRLFTLIVIVNLALITRMAVCTSRDPASFTYADATSAVATNLFVAMLLRHEHFINLIFRIALRVPHRLPVSIRKHAAKVYTYGGVHSSCGLSAAMWYIFFTVLLVNNFVAGNDREAEAVAVLAAFMLFVFSILLVMSIPRLRQSFHNAWEISHRLAGWSAFAIVWVQIILVAYPSGGQQQGHSVVQILVETPALWLLLATTYLLLFPWACMRKYSVHPEYLSSHAVRLHFKGRRLSSCMGVKLSDSPLRENHSFATIRDANGEKRFSCVVSDAGDWTRKIINNPPKKLWMRGAPVMGVMRLCFAFRSIVIVATGSGIGPCMSFLAIHPEWNCRIVWSARMPAMTFGNTIMNTVLKADEKAVIIDSEKIKKPKPQLSEVVYAVYKESGAEAVIIISNPKATQDVVYELESRKIPAFGAIFDS